MDDRAVGRNNTAA